ncbi:hypothetical protein A1O1_02991 [Capronia coronata CBS 617.96]|uniref:Phosphatidate phosphatase APP1 catalytic domain-containing protein n=1 Tax=Capronia coronata CBS 617.96 TaxID=1182541 RepID=W9YY33_9EURO|nr:uncharacterized protein A1O1_02991 [Capronia coronata CBS 617.96]EXJ94595.1 hypothetical protein A1O1_02991 [Capronia coronata CBS 617.96]
MPRTWTSSKRANRVEPKASESLLEAQSRKDANFSEVEARLPKRYARSEMGFIDKRMSFLGSHNPFGRKACPRDNTVWVLDNTAYKPTRQGDDTAQPWEAEFVSYFFGSGGRDQTKSLNGLAEVMGLGDNTARDPETRKRMEERLKPLLMTIAPARTVEILIPSPDADGSPQTRVLGPSGSDGISSQTVAVGGSDEADGKTITCTSEGEQFPGLSCKTRYVGPEGWAIISDIDDTVKTTQTPSPAGILRFTFTDTPKTVAGMEEFYKVLAESFRSPAWFYLSASPYNLYPFLREFLIEHYPPGTIILRDARWLHFGGLLQSFTAGVQEYKTSRIEKIRSWLPDRQFICVGNSTQSDPEAYAQMYAKYPGWIKAIYIRKVLDAPHMEERNKNQRFIEAFKDVPDHVWRVFIQPQELSDHIKHLAGQAHPGMIGTLLGRWCQTEHDMKAIPRKGQLALPPLSPTAGTAMDAPSPLPADDATVGTGTA